MGALVVGNGTEAVDVDAGRNDGGRQVLARDLPSLARDPGAGGDDVRGLTKHAAQEAVRPGQASRHADLGAVNHDGVGHGEPAAHVSKREGGVENRERGAGAGNDGVDARRNGAHREQHLLVSALDAERLGGVEGGVARVGGREDRKAIGRQPAPQLPQVGLDAAQLGREVVGDENVGQWAAFGGHDPRGLSHWLAR